MQMLDNDWLTNNPIDFEYKKYLLLAYDQRLSIECDKQKLYPYFTDLVDKIKIVNEFLQNVRLFEQSRVSVSNIDWENKKLVYNSMLNDPNLDEVKKIAEYSKSVLYDLYTKYRQLLDNVDGSISISGCRVEIFNLYDGFLILKLGVGKEKIMKYEVNRILYPNPHYVLKTFKADLKEYYNNRYTKNVFDVIFKEDFPMKESILPVYKRKFLETLFGFC